jgi:hypothetical protein
VSGNEKSDSEPEPENERKQQKFHAIKLKNVNKINHPINHNTLGNNLNNSKNTPNHNNRSNSINLLNVNNNHTYSSNTHNNKTPFILNTNNKSNSNYKPSNSKIKNESEFYKNSEINNKRFDKSANTPNKYKPHPSTNLEKENMKSVNKTTANKKIINQIKQDYDYEYDIEHEINPRKNADNNCGEENVEIVPRPLDIKYEVVDTVKLNDFKSNKSQKIIAPSVSNLSINQNVLYMPDHVASKLVNDILNSKLEK